MYAFGMSQRDIQAHLKEIYGVEVSAELISKITDTVIEEVRQWQQRPLDKLYTIVYLDALIVNSREKGVVEKKAVYIALGINIEGKKEVLGLWIAENEGARFWTGILNELKNRGIEDILIACIDGLSGFQEAINTVVGFLTPIKIFRHSLFYRRQQLITFQINLFIYKMDYSFSSYTLQI